MFLHVSNTLQHTVLILFLINVSSVVAESQKVNLTKLLQFRYKCGIDSCHILTQFCVYDDGPLRCEYCNEDVCNSDREDYLGCSIACDYQDRKRLEAIQPVSPTGATLMHSSPQTATVTRKIITSSTEIKTIKQHPLTVVLVILLICSFCLNIILCACCSNYKQKWKGTEEKRNTESDIGRSEASTEKKVLSTITNGIMVVPVDSQSEMESKIIMRNPESGYNTPDNSPEEHRKATKEKVPSTNDEPEESDESTRKFPSVIASPQGPYSNNLDDPSIVPSGSKSNTLYMK